jgi:hypothetical protein
MKPETKTTASLAVAGVDRSERPLRVEFCRSILVPRTAALARLARGPDAPRWKTAVHPDPTYRSGYSSLNFIH